MRDSDRRREPSPRTAWFWFTSVSLVVLLLLLLLLPPWILRRRLRTQQNQAPTEGMQLEGWFFSLVFSFVPFLAKRKEVRMKKITGVRVRVTTQPHSSSPHVSKCETMRRVHSAAAAAAALARVHVTLHRHSNADPALPSLVWCGGHADLPINASKRNFPFSLSHPTGKGQWTLARLNRVLVDESF